MPVTLSEVADAVVALETKLGTGASVATAGAFLKGTAPGVTAYGSIAISDVLLLQAALDLKAPLASPTFTGTPAAPTQLTADDSTRLATTAFVHAVIAALPPSGANPAGSGSELQFRSSGSAFGAVTGSSVSGSNVALAGSLTLQGSANNAVLAGATTTNPVTLTATGTDTNISVKIVPKGLGFLQLGPDTHGPTYSAGFEYYNLNAPTGNYGGYIETYVTDAASGTGSGLIVIAGTQGVGAVNNIQSVDGVYGLARSDLPAGRTATRLSGLNFQAYATGGGTATDADGVFTQVLADTGSTIANGHGVRTWIYDLAPSTGGKAYGFYADWKNDVSFAESYGLWVGDAAGRATNPYYAWFDSRGVFRIKEENNQAIVALYNPSFTKYTPGSANYERIVTQWNNDVIRFETEAGGTGTRRNLLIGAPVITLDGTVAANGAIQPASLADSAAPNNSIYFSTDASKLVYKTNGGTPTPLY